MRDLYEPIEVDGPDALVRSVRQVLSEVYEAASHAAPADRHEFAFSVLLNSLSSVLEAVRCETPEAFGTYQQMVQLAAQDA